MDEEDDIDDFYFEDFERFSYDEGEEYGDEKDYGEKKYAEEEYDDEEEKKFVEEEYDDGYDDIEEEDIYQYEEDVYTDTYSDLQRIGGGYKGASNFAARTGKEITLAKIYGILSGNIYSKYLNKIKNEIISTIELIPEKKLILLNLNIIIPVVIYIIKYKNKVSSQTLETFIREVDLNKNILDFVRYLRMMKRFVNIEI